MSVPAKPPAVLEPSKAATYERRKTVENVDILRATSGTPVGIVVLNRDCPVWTIVFLKEMFSHCLDVRYFTTMFSDGRKSIMCNRPRA